MVHWVRKFSFFFCSDREYIIGRRIWDAGQAYYCVTKGVPCPSMPRHNKPKRVDLHYSSWCIRLVINYPSLIIGGATARCQASSASTAGDTEEGVILAEAYMATGPCPPYATDGRYRDILTSNNLVHQPAMSVVPFVVLCSTPRHDRHYRLHSTVDVLDIPEIFSVVDRVDAAEQGPTRDKGSPMTSIARPVTDGRCSMPAMVYGGGRVGDMDECRLPRLLQHHRGVPPPPPHEELRRWHLDTRTSQMLP
ncbi:uncharacterized protein DS421_20g700980 [Arachis hypogaea]|nr:uncharacterized protein DS421_20g700980 [Arachis hypogaea]